MKKSLIVMMLLSSVFAFAYEGKDTVTGIEAQAMFNDLSQGYEYNYAAIVKGLEVETVTRHNGEDLSCSKETTRYLSGQAHVVFTCKIGQ